MFFVRLRRTWGLCAAGPRSGDVSAPKSLPREDCEAVATALMRVISARWLTREGLFRIPGNARTIAEALARLEAAEDPEVVLCDLVDDDAADEACEVCASLLRKWLPRVVEDTERSPFAPQMFAFLARVADEDANRMPAANLANVFAPLFLNDPAFDARDPSAHAAYMRDVLGPAIEAFKRKILDAQSSNFSVKGLVVDDSDGTSPPRVFLTRKRSTSPTSRRRDDALPLVSQNGPAQQQQKRPSASSQAPREEEEETNPMQWHDAGSSGLTDSTDDDDDAAAAWEEPRSDTTDVEHPSFVCGFYSNRSFLCTMPS